MYISIEIRREDICSITNDLFRIKHGVSNVKIFSDPDGSVYAENFSDIRKKFRDLKELVAWHKTHTIKHFSVSGGIGDICLTQPIID